MTPICRRQSERFITALVATSIPMVDMSRMTKPLAALSRAVCLAPLQWLEGLRGVCPGFQAGWMISLTASTRISSVTLDRDPDLI